MFECLRKPAPLLSTNFAGSSKEAKQQQVQLPRLQQHKLEGASLPLCGSLAWSNNNHVK
jgi:hypothetical protein